EVEGGKEVLALQSVDDPRGASFPLGCGAIAFSPDGSRLASGGAEAGFHLWDAASGKELARHGGGRHAGATGLAFASDGKTVYVTTWSSGVSAWSLDPSPEKLVRPFDGPHARCVAAARNAKVIAGGGTDGTVRAWDASGKLLFQGTGLGAPVSAVAVSADGQLVAAAGSNSVVKVWDLETAQLRAEYKGHLGRVNGLSFAPDGRLVSGGGDGVVYVWGAPTPSELDRMWAELGGADAGRAFKAIGELVAQPDKSVPYLARRIPKPDTERVRTLINQLSGKEISTAVDELARLGSLVEPELRRAKDAAKTDGAKALLGKLLDPKGPAAWPNEGLRLTRTVEALERIGTPAARKLLQQVVTDWKETAPGRDAAESLERLNSRKP
ncbi:MAG TPA: hypothetical protein VMZ71_16785, partial [Gemmataceae bacterium]|nr:hypothetical protein [Gemmataceae bacterium]